MEFDKVKKNFVKISSNKKYQWFATIAIFLVILFIGINIRIQPIINENLIDVTTGDYIPLALDPYYFLRISETLVANNGVLPEVDNMRYQALNSGWNSEILPLSTVLLWKITTIFNTNATLNFANVINPVVFFGLGLILFFILVWILTKSKWVSIVASLILVLIPPYLYRTLAGFSDHESIGMFGFFLALLVFTLGMYYLETKKSNGIYSGLIGLASGFSIMFAIASWGGGAKFLFMILPLAFLIRWLTKKDKLIWNYVLFYGFFVLGSLLFAPVFGYNSIHILKAFMLSSVGLLTPFVFGYCLIEAFILGSKNIPKLLKKNSEILSIVSIIILGGIFYQIFIGHIFTMIYDLILKILYPFGTERVGLTVAENKQPYLTELVSQVGKNVFYLFLLGCFIVGGKLASGIKKKKFKYLFAGSFILFIFGILFSKYSPTSILSGENFISKLLFAISFLIFFVSCIYIYKNSEWKVDLKWIFIAAWMIPMLLAVRSAIRVFFAIVPFISLMIPITIFEFINFGRKNKDGLIKLISISIAIIFSLLLILSLSGYYGDISNQAKHQTPSYNVDWQNAMDWVRNNTEENSVFLHWWDYGYWVQTGGNRPTVTDGGHFNGYWDHLIGRYVLTTPYPETAKSFMLAHNVSYLLIDPTDIGKYGAYSSIGNDNDSNDRASYISTFTSNPSDDLENRDSITMVYRGGVPLDDDIIYNTNDSQVFLPKGRAYIGAILIENKIVKMENQTGGIPNQPIGIYVYNNQQYRLPIRYLYYNNKLIDFDNGINATIYLYSNVINNQISQNRATMYLSEKVKDSLVVKLYLMNDVNDEYTELELVHSESNYPFDFNYGGYRGPIKIYKVNKDAMNNIIARTEFTAISGGYGELDDLEFVK